MTVLAELFDAIEARAEAEPDAVVPLLELLANPDGESTVGGDRTVAHAAARRVNAERLAVAERELRAGSWGTGEVRERLGASRQAVHVRLQAGHLLAAKVGSRLVYPDWQFTPTGARPRLAEVLAALRAIVGDDARAADAVMRAPQPDLPGSPSPAALFADGRVDDVLHLLSLRADQS
jgi:hypothetical protein